MLSLSDLLLLRRNLTELSEVPYFNDRVYLYIDDLLLVLNYCIENFTSLDPTVVGTISINVWSSYNHLSGTTTKNIPYEMEYLLRKSMSHWVGSDFIVTTAFTDNNGSFYCWNVNVLSEIDQLIPGLNFKAKDLFIVQIAMPAFYTKVPIYIAPMYHEAGHFVDNLHSISLNALYRSTFNNSLLSALNLPPSFVSLTPQQQEFLVERHFSEYFCDIFAASFIGNAISKFLNHIAPNEPDSLTHPATSKRVANVDAFLNGVTTPITQEFDEILRGLGLAPLSVRHSLPDISTAMNNVETYPIKNDEEAHGIIMSYWSHLEYYFSSGNLKEFESYFEVLNDLIVKSIRNYNIKEKWRI